MRLNPFDPNRIRVEGGGSRFPGGGGGQLGCGAIVIALIGALVFGVDPGQTPGPGHAACPDAEAVDQVRFVNIHSPRAVAPFGPEGKGLLSEQQGARIEPANPPESGHQMPLSDGHPIAAEIAESGVKGGSGMAVEEPRP